MIVGLQKLTILDFPGKTACILFTGGCNFRCPFCHNADLVTDPHKLPPLPESEIFAFLEKRAGLLDGVCVTGGEPLLYENLPLLLQYAKNLGYAVKLDTNGMLPDKLKELVQKRLIDYIAMDIKNAPQKYALTAGVAGISTESVSQSIHFLIHGTTDYEFRTTVVKEFHEESDFEQIAEWAAGAKRYFLQPFRKSEQVMDQSLSPPSDEALRAFKGILERTVQQVEIRGK